MRRRSVATTPLAADDDVAEPTTVESLQSLQRNGDLARACRNRIHFVLTEDSALWAGLTDEIKTSGLWFVALDVRISIARGRGQPDWRSDVAEEFFRELGEWPRVRAIALVGLGTPTDPFPIGHLVQLLREPQRERRLKGLDLIRMTMEPVPRGDAVFWQDSQEEVFLLKLTLQRLRRVRRFYWEEFLTQSETSVLGHPYILNSLLMLPRLESLTLQGWGSLTEKACYLGAIEGNSLAKCCDSLRLEELTLRNFRIRRPALELTAKTLRYNGMLRKLDLDLTGAPGAGVVAFWNAYRANRAITTTELWISHSDDWKRHRCLQRLAECLVSNRSLLVVVLTGPGGRPSAGRRFSNDDARAFVQMLESSCFGPITLELDNYQGVYAPLIRLHTHMNLEGSGALVVPAPETISQEMWMRLFLVAATTRKPVSSLYRIDAIFQILQRNPALLADAAAHVTDPNPISLH